jgi:hypothetical protein
LVYSSTGYPLFLFLAIGFVTSVIEDRMLTFGRHRFASNITLARKAAKSLDSRQQAF